MELGKLTFVPASETPELVAEPVRPHLQDGLWVSEIDPGLADTAAFCEHYGIGLDISANCVVVEARRAERTWKAACLVLATTRADVNGVVRKHLGARKISFAPMDTAVSLTGMEYGGITPVGLPVHRTAATARLKRPAPRAEERDRLPPGRERPGFRRRRSGECDGSRPRAHRKRHSQFETAGRRGRAGVAAEQRGAGDHQGGVEMP
ncbi:MAG: hypothetical protein QOJ20_2827 [Mycobacterium sp.]|nr:hypothetical protein [Mycobacterium sp.]